MTYYVRKKQSDFIPAPEGLHYCVCADVVDLGGVEQSWQGNKTVKDMLRIVWQTETKMTTGPKSGQPYLITKRYTSSNHKKATLRIHVQSWAGKSFTDEQFAALDLEKLIGRCCQIQVTHNENDGITYANIMAIVPPPADKSPLKVHDYKRVKDRDDYKKPKSVAEQRADVEQNTDIQEQGEPIEGWDTEQPEPEGDDIPF